MNNLPIVADARLPQTYENAKQSLATCDRIDECKDWADKSAAMASYAKQAGDDSLHKMAMRIQVRAIRRAGQLLEQMPKAVGGRPTETGSTERPVISPPTLSEIGITKTQSSRWQKVAAIQADEFEAAVESDNPPTITEMAKAGTASRPRNIVDLNGRDPSEFNKAMHFVGAFEQAAEAIDRKLKEVGGD